MIDANLIIVLLAAITLLAGLANRIRVPYPVVLVLGGLVLGLVPGLPSARLNPDLVLVLFLPPLLYSSAVLSSVGELRANAGPILLLAVGLVLATVGGVAVLGALVVGLPWAVAFVLGGVLGPTDPVSAGAILQRLGAPERIVTILEGESLVNDGTAITAYTIAVAAVQTGRFSMLNAVGTFAFEVVVGTAIGLAAAWVATRVQRRLDAGAELAVTLLIPFIAYIPAQAAGASGVLAAVSAGLYAATRQTELSTADARLRIGAFWQLLTFLLNAVLFLLIGLQVGNVVGDIPGGLSVELVLDALAVGVVVLGIRMLWMFTVSPVARALRRGHGGTPVRPAARLVLGWSAMRGAVTLALALAIPLHASAGRLFPARPTVVFLAYAGVLITLVPPGLTLGPLIVRTGLRRSARRVRRLAEAQARVLHAALEEIEAQAAADRVDDDTATRLRGLYEARLDRLDARLQADGPMPPARDDELRRLRRAVIRAQRDTLADLRLEHYPADVLREIGHDLDLEEARLR